MKKEKTKLPSIVLVPGYFMEQEYHDYASLEVSSSENWAYDCTYQLLPDAITGRHRFLQLQTMQLSFGTRPGGMMHDVHSASDCISIAVMCTIADKACFDTMKLKEDDILFFDSTKAYNFMSNNSIDFAVISVKKSALGERLASFSSACNYRIKDTDKVLSSYLKKLWDETSLSHEDTDYDKMEEEILYRIDTLLQNQDLIPSTLTKGEKISLAIRDQVYKHMDGNVTISSFAAQHDISEKTLQNSFQSLFGFTPKLFLRQLKLNLVHHDLKNAQPTSTTVSKIARKWGFSHMGRFSQYYTALFGKNPSLTLKSVPPSKQGIEKNCVLRQEEID